MTQKQQESARKLLCALQDNIRDTLSVARLKAGKSFARIAAVTAADTIYQVDRIIEEAILRWFEREWPAGWPVEIVMEGVEDGETLTFPRGLAAGKTLYKCILDPIDGTRSLMYDKRSAWTLAALAPQRGGDNQIQDILVATMTELPTSKMWRSDQFSAVRGGGVKARAFDLRLRQWSPLRVRPAQSDHFEHGFASLARFFPEGKGILGAMEEELWRKLGLWGKGGGQLVFDDQYLSTGGQLHGLLAGHDRMLGDLRPLAYAKLGLGSAAICCHPYDICTALILQEAGGVVETPDGRPLTPPLNTTSPVAWMGYANPVLAKKVRPVLRRLIGEYF